MKKIYNVLFLCAANSARSIFAEAILNREGAGRFVAYSAGSRPRGTIDPHAMTLLTTLGFETTALSSKSWEEFAKPGAPEMDFVFTVCDEAAGEVCPVWPGVPVTVHWSIPDPVIATGDEIDRAFAFREVFRALETRIKIFIELSDEQLASISIKHALHDIDTTQRQKP